jgi:hypothetical protein
MLLVDQPFRHEVVKSKIDGRHGFPVGYVMATLAVRCVLACVIYTACATLGAILPLRFSEVEDRDSELRLLGPSTSRPLGGAALRLWTRVQNPNAVGLTLTDIEGDLLIADAEAIAVDFPLGLPLVALQDTVIPLDISIGFDDLPRLASVARAAIEGRSLPYRLDGRFGVAAGALGEVRFGPLTLLSGEFRVR